MATKKKNAISKMAKGLILGELKRFKTIIAKYYPDGKEKKDILKTFEEISIKVEKSLV